jgi:hypothetical protein
MDPGKGWVLKKSGCRPQRDKPPWESNTAHKGNGQEDVSLRNSGTTHERHLQAEHDPPCNSGTIQERHLQAEHDPLCERDAGFKAIKKDRQSNRDGGRIRQETILQEESRKYGLPDGDN